LRAGKRIDLQRAGGVIRFRSGKTLRRGAMAVSMPQIGSRYLLFLKHDKSTQDYSIVMGYQLKGGKVFRLDELRWEDANYPQVEHPLRLEDAKEEEFRSRVIRESTPSKSNVQP
jgi:hypothetical protein